MDNRVCDQLSENLGTTLVRLELVSPSHVGPSAALAQSLEHVLAHGCRDVAGSKRLDGSHDWQNMALSRHGSQNHEDANVCSAEVLA